MEGKLDFDDFGSMRSCFLYFGVLVFLLPGSTARSADASPKEDDIPLVGRPSGFPFSGASGAFDVEVQAEPTTLHVEQPLTYTVTIRAKAKVNHPPHRLDLHQLPAFDNHFYIDDDATREQHPASDTWQFIYSLKPRRINVSEVPGLPFIYFNPAYPVHRGFQMRFTDAIPLRTLPAEDYHPKVPIPEEVYQLASDSVLHPRPRAWISLGPAALVFLLLVVPPLACGGWYVAWRRFFPDAIRRKQIRRSRAAKRALNMIDGIGHLPLSQRVEQTVIAVNQYLRERFELNTAEPTPIETADILKQTDCSSSLVNEVICFLKECDAARFASDVAGAEGLTEKATQLILDMELETWKSHRS